MDAAYLLSHRGWESLVAFVNNELPDTDAQLVERLAGESPSVAERIAKVRSVLGEVQAIRAENADWQISPALRQRLLALRHPAAASWVTSAVERAREVLAGLLLDSRTMGPALAGFRGVSTARHMIYGVDDAEIEFRVSAGAMGRMLVVGHVHAADPLASVLLQPLPDGAAIEVSPDDSGMFEFETSPGAFEATFALGERRVVIPLVEFQT